MTRSMGTPYGELLTQQAMAAASPSVLPGVSGYFTKPGNDLDPNLFDGEHLKPAVRKLILNQVMDFLGHRYRAVDAWLKVWIAGSGASYQWAADRDPRDLDVLLAVDHVRFRETNPMLASLGDEVIDARMTQELKTGLWPSTAHTVIGTGHYEATYYVNPGHEDIREINPYAAYDVRRDRWTVRPIDVPADWDPVTQASPEWWKTNQQEVGTAQAIVARYNAIRNRLASLQVGTPQWMNTQVDLVHVIDQGSAMFDSLHGDRRKAFDPGGLGYFDYYNFRWQAAKRAGVTPALHEMKTLQVTAQQGAQTSLYGQPVADAHEALTQALLAARRGS